VRLIWRAGEAWAVPILGKSNLIYTLIQASGLVKIPLDSTGIDEGTWVTVSLDA
jgi:molybdopterin molybdotransferase